MFVPMHRIAATIPTRAVLIAITAAIAHPGMARADLIACTVYCYPNNPLTLVSGLVETTVSDGEAVQNDANRIIWGPGLNNNLLGGGLSVTTSAPPNTLETGNASGTLIVGPPYQLPTIQLNATAADINPFGLTLGSAGAQGELSYQVTVLHTGTAGTWDGDPSDHELFGTPVSISIDALVKGNGLTVNSEGDGAAGSASIIVTNNSTGASIADFEENGAFGTVPFHKSVTLIAGTVYDVELDAGLGARGNATGSLLVDPSFTIDPSDPNANQLVVLASNGIGPGGMTGSGPVTSTVPEPSSLGLIVAGLLAWIAVRVRWNKGLFISTKSRLNASPLLS